MIRLTNIKGNEVKKIDIEEFIDLVEGEIDAFKDEMITRNFSKRNQKQWFKMMGDYLGCTSTGALDNCSSMLDEDDDEDETDDSEVLFEKVKKRTIGEYF